jgi:hypothetical protein
MRDNDGRDTNLTIVARFRRVSFIVFPEMRTLELALVFLVKVLWNGLVVRLFLQTPSQSTSYAYEHSAFGELARAKLSSSFPETQYRI